MQFSVLLALLPLALASPVATNTQPCCTDCSGSLSTDCIKACPEQPYFNYCKWKCTYDRVNCLADCNNCETPRSESLPKPGPGKTPGHGFWGP